MKIQIFSFFLLFVFIYSDAQAQQNYNGFRRQKKVHAKKSRDTFYVEVLHPTDERDVFLTNFDTLVFNGSFYEGNIYHINDYQDKLKLFPGRILLNPYTPDWRSYSTRNIAYINNKFHELNQQWEWLKIIPHPAFETVGRDNSIINGNPDTAYKKIDAKIQYICDTLTQNYWKHISRIRVSNDRWIFRKTYGDFTDTSHVKNVFDVILKPKKVEYKKLVIFKIQYIPLAIVESMFWALSDYYVVFYDVPISRFIALGLYKLEKTIVDRFVAGSTFQIKVYSGNKIIRLKIRNNTIVNKLYVRYKYPFNFRQNILEACK